MSYKGVPRAGQGKLKGIGATADQPALKSKLDSQRKNPRPPKLQDLNIQVQESQKSTQRAVK